MIAWHDSLLLPWESAWSVGQKLAWLNAGRPRDVLKHLVRRWHDAARHIIHPVDSGRFPWADNCASDTAQGKQLHATLAARFGRGSDVARWCQRMQFGLTWQVRYCPVCLAGGFHSIIHQIPGLARCPIDGALLRNDCPKCERAIGAYDLIDFAPFECPHCSHPFRDPGAPFFRTDDDGADGRTGRLELVGRWAADAMERLAPDAAWLELEWVDIAWEGTRRVVPMREAIMGLCHTVIPFPLASDLGPPTLVHVSYSADLELTDPLTVFPLENVRETIQVVRGDIRARLGSHATCYDAGAALMREGYGRSGYDIPWYEGFCPTAYAVLAWEKRAAGYARSLRLREAKGEVNHTYARLAYLESALRNLFEYSLFAARFSQFWRSRTNYSTAVPACKLRPAPWLQVWGTVRDSDTGDWRWSTMPRLSMAPDSGFWFDRCDGGLVEKYLRLRKTTTGMLPPYHQWVKECWTPTTGDPPSI
ncbi:hypothetical protein [Xanthomonas sp. NCPPB 2632]|uniref:hypothetical protein n=1 Tax=Xanthomonas sp. NCPPB 2632 TaxID=3240912 RepID=UPI003513CC5A